MPCTNDEAQLPTPTTATRTSSRCRSAPFAEPFFVAIKSLLWKIPGGGRESRSNRRTLLARRSYFRCRRLARHQGLPHVPDPLGDRKHGETRKHIDGSLQQLEIPEPGAFREDEADRQHDHPDRPGRQAHLALDAERLGTGP